MKKLTSFLGILTIICSMVCFLRCCDYGIVNLDDYIYLTTHPFVITWQGTDSLRDFLTNVHESIWMPLTWSSYALDYALFGDWYGGFHLHSIAIHAVNACLVWWFLRLLFHNRLHADVFCLIATLIWAVHPLRCESVVFLASRKDVLSLFWELLAMICWTKAGRCEDGNRTAWVQTALATLFFVIGSACKPSVMTFPILCLIVDTLILRKIHVLRYLVPVAYMLFLGGFAAWQQSAGGATGALGHVPIWGRLLGACAAFGIYLRNFVWPQWLAPQCLNIWPEFPRFMIPGLVISAITGTFLVRKMLFFWNTRKLTFAVERLDDLPVRITNTAPTDFPLAGVAFYCFAIAPMLGIANFGFHAFADRFTYIPSIGLSILAVAALLKASKRIGRTIPLIGSTLAVVALFAATYRQTGFWQDDRTLFSHTVEVDGERNAYALCNLADWYFEFPHDLEAAVDAYERSIAYGIQHSISSYPLYMIALGESGRADKIPERLRLYEDAVRAKLGSERAQAILSYRRDIDERDIYDRAVYRVSKLADHLYARTNLTEAKELIEEGPGTDALSDNPVWLYLCMKYHEKSGNVREAEAVRQRILSPKDKRSRIQFRFLRNAPR